MNEGLRIHVCASIYISGYACKQIFGSQNGAYMNKGKDENKIWFQGAQIPHIHSV